MNELTDLSVSVPLYNLVCVRVILLTPSKSSKVQSSPSHAKNGMSRSEIVGDSRYSFGITEYASFHPGGVTCDDFGKTP